MSTNINDTFFDGQYKEIWRAMIPGILTEREVDFMISYFNLQAGSKVLDIMCGYGRHAIALAEREMDVTAVDNLEAYIDEITRTAIEKKISVKAIKADAATYEADGQFDLVICMGNSLNFFNAEDIERIFHNISSSLKKGAHLLINSWSIAEIAFRNFKASSSGEINGVTLGATSAFHIMPTRTETISTMTGADGNTETRTAIDYIYSIAEMEIILNKAGLTLMQVYSIPGKKIFTLGDPRAYIIASK